MKIEGNFKVTRNDSFHTAQSGCGGACCRNLPAPPSPTRARQDLVKQLALYLNLSSMLYENSQNDVRRANVAQQEVDEDEEEEEDEDDDSDLERVVSNVAIKFKPLIPMFNDLNEPLIGRDWLFKEIDRALTSHQLVVLSGLAGTGKTRICNHLFRLSSTFLSTSSSTASSSSSSSSSSCVKPNSLENNKFHTLNSISNEFVQLQINKSLTSLVGACHFCTSDDFRTLDLVQFVQNLIWCLTNCEALNAVGNNSSSNAFLQLINKSDSIYKQISNSDVAAKLEPSELIDKCLIEPLSQLMEPSSSSQSIRLKNRPPFILIVIDAIDTPSSIGTEQSNPIAKYFVKSMHKFPTWLKFLVTVRNESDLFDDASIKKRNYFHLNLDGVSTMTMTSRLKNSTSSFSSLDDTSMNSTTANGTTTTSLASESLLFQANHHQHQLHNNYNGYLNKDLTDYITHRINKSVDIQKNILYFNCLLPSNNSNNGGNLQNNSVQQYLLNELQTTSKSYRANASTLCSSPSFYTQHRNQSSGLSSLIQSSCTLNKSDSNFQFKFIQYLSSLSQNSFLFVKLVLDLIERGCLIIKSANFKVLPRNMDDLLKLYFNLKFPSRFSYDRLASQVFAICLASFRPLTLNEIYETLNCAYFNAEKFTWTDLMDQMNHLDTFMSTFRYFDPDLDRNLIINLTSSSSLSSPSHLVRTPLYKFTHPVIRDWWLENQFGRAKSSSSSFSSASSSSSSSSQQFDLKWAHFLHGMRLMRLIDFDLNVKNKSLINRRTCFELMRHLIISSNLLLLDSSKQSANSKYENYDQQFDTLTYLICLNLPANINTPANCSFYTSLLASNEFLSAPDENIFRLLINLGANFNVNVNGLPFICLLCKLGHVNLLKILVKNYKLLFDSSDTSSFKCKDSSEKNCLAYALMSDKYECVKFVLDYSVDPLSMILQVDKSSNQCPLYSICSSSSSSSLANSSREIMDLFIDKMIYSRNACNDASCARAMQQAILLCATVANVDCLRLLVKRLLVDTSTSIIGRGFSIDQLDMARGETPLTVACTNGHRQVCELLIELGNASLSSCNSKSWTPLLCAVKSGEWEIVEYLLNRNGQIIDQADKHGRTALIMAASEGHLAIIDILIEKGANRMCHDRDGLSALSWSCLKGHYNAALALLNSGIDVNHADYSGRTPLDLATFYGDVRLVQLLVERGAQLDHVDNIGMRPLDRAIGCRNVPVVVFFLKKGAKLSPATWAMAAGKPEIVVTLLNKLVEDGNTLYRKGSYTEALHRYSYTLKKFPKDPNELAVQPNNLKAIIEMKFNLLLNLARCNRKLEDFQSSIDLCSKAIELKQDSYEAFFSRARAKRDAKQLDSAMDDLIVASKLCPTNGDVRKLMIKINEEKLNQHHNQLNGTLKKEKTAHIK